QRRQMVQLDRQGPQTKHSDVGVPSSCRQRRGRWSGPCDSHDVRRTPGREPEATQRGTAEWELSSPADPASPHSQTWDEGDATPGNPDGTRPGGSNGGKARAGADLRARFRGAELRLSSWKGLQRRTPPSGTVAQERLHMDYRR